MSPFEPAGQQARWRTLYQRLRKVNVGDVLTYEEMGALLQLDPVVDRHTLQMAMRRAAQELEKVDKHAVDSVVNTGYRVVEAADHVMLAKRHQRKAGKSLVRSHSKVVNVDLNNASPELRHVLEVGAAVLSAQMDFNRRMDLRQSNLERVVQAVATKTDHTDEALAELRDRLVRLEQRKTSGS
jgi:hypothetical protein